MHISYNLRLKDIKVKQLCITNLAELSKKLYFCRITCNPQLGLVMKRSHKTCSGRLFRSIKPVALDIP